MAQRSEQLINWTPLVEGWTDRQDTTKALGLFKMKNAIISDRGGVATRPGTELLGVSDSSGTPITTLFTAKRRDGTNILVRASGTTLEYYNTLTNSWAVLKSGFTSGQVFGLANHNLSSDALDYLYYCNAVEPYQRWTMAFEKTTSALSGGETSIPITTVLDSNVYHSNTAVSVTTTTITVPANTWANNIWNSGYYVRITSGASTGSISPISATTSTQITFTAIAGLAGTPTFEIRRLKFPASGTFVYGNGSTMSYTQVVKDNALPVASAPALASGSAIAAYPEELMNNGCPRGNILKTIFQIMLVSGTKSAPTTVYRSKINNAADFTYSATRVAGEGDVIEFPDDGERITDLSIREDQIEVFKESQIYDLSFTQDASDLPKKNTRVNSPLIGTAGRTFRAGDDIMFVSPAKEVTSLSRVPYRDTQPQRTNLAWPIKRGIRNYDFSSVRGYTFRNYTVVAAKATSSSSTNDKVIVFDNNLQKWIGEWEIPAADFAVYNNELYFGSSASKEVYKMFTTRTTQVKGTDLLPYDTYCETHWVNKSSDQLSTQKFNMLAIAGYVRLNTPITFSLYYDFSTEAKHTWTFDPANQTIITNNILGDTAEASLGVTPLGVTPLSIELSATDIGDYNEQKFLIYYTLPFDDHIWAKLSWSTTGVDQYAEITDISANFMDGNTQYQQKLVRSIETT